MAKRSALYAILISFIIVILPVNSVIYGQSNLSKVIKNQTGSGAKIRATFSYSPVVPVTGVSIRFICKTNYTPDTWLWEFGDGTISYEPSPAHDYDNPGIYNVSLTVSLNGSSARTTKKVRVYAAKATATETKTQELVPAFEFSPATPEVGLNVQFTDQSTGSPTSWSWDFGDGGKSTVQNPQHQYNSSGTFNVTLTVSNGTSTKSLTKTITVIAALTPGFNYSPSNPESGEVIQFQDTTSGNPTSWSWNFGDGSTSNLQNPTHSYNNAGSYNVTLQVSNGYYTKSISKSVTVLAPIVVDFTYNPTAPVAGQDVQFVNSSTGSITSYAWNFGDGATSTLKDPVHKYNNAGAYTVTLTASNSRGSKSKSKTITINQSLNPSFTYTPSSPYAGQSVQFTDTSSGSPTSWQWNFGDSSSSNLQNPSHTYLSAGTYTVTLTVTNSAETKATSKTITVKPVVRADFTYSPTNPMVGTSIQFTDKSTGNITSWSWQFGDGGTSTQKNPTKTYSAAGSYNVKLTVSDGTTSNSMTQTVTVAAAIIADFSYSPASPIVGQEVQFLDNSQGSPTSWTWNFGDGATSTAKNPTHAYSQSGTYTVKLTVSNGTASSSQSKSLTVSSSSKRTITAASCALADVQAAIAEANPGDTVIVPAGRATWDKNLIIRKGITLKGMGIDSTVITCNYNGTGEIMNPGGYFITYEPSSPEGDQPFRLTGFTFNLNNKSGTGGLLLRNPTSYHQTKIRIDHTKWDNVVSGGNIWWIYGYFWGVADNNHFDTPGRFRFYALDSITWSNEIFTFGSANNFYMEDNFIRAHNDDFFYLEAAGRLALRYNTLYFDVQSSGYYPVVDVHGNQPTAWSAAMGFEGYGNEIYAAFGMRLIDMRAGRNLFYNNKITQSSGSSTISAREEYYDSNNPPAHAPDGQPQHVSDSYVFNNYRNGSVLIADFPYTGSQLYYSDEGYYVPTEDLHYWKHNIKFNGSSGVGVGLMSQRPSSCSKEGVAWWSTDENKLYRWKNGRWELYYTPYIYPHPLRTILGD